jgi:hypothetical protein
MPDRSVQVQMSRTTNRASPTYKLQRLMWIGSLKKETL